MQGPEIERLRGLNGWLGLSDPTRGRRDFGEGDFAERLKEDRLELTQVAGDNTTIHLRQVCIPFLACGCTPKCGGEGIPMLDGHSSLPPSQSLRAHSDSDFWGVSIREEPVSRISNHVAVCSGTQGLRGVQSETKCAENALACWVNKTQTSSNFESLIGGFFDQGIWQLEGPCERCEMNRGIFIPLPVLSCAGYR